MLQQHGRDVGAVDAPQSYIIEVRPSTGSVPSATSTFELQASEQKSVTVVADNGG